MTLSETVQYGYTENVIESLKTASVAEALRARHLDPETLRHNLQAQLKKTTASGEAQERKKREAVRSTIVHNADFKDLAAATSGTTDVIAHGLGKNSPEARNILRERSRAYRP